MNLTSLLPKPKHAQTSFPTATVIPNKPVTTMAHIDGISFFEPPPYGKRAAFQPSGVEDFGDGGAFPEIHILQYPLDMGRKDKSVKSKTALITVDADGSIKYDAIVKQSMRDGKKVFTSYNDLIEKHFEQDELAKPDIEEEMKLAEATRKAFGQIVDQKVSLAKATRIRTEEKKEPVFIRYTPSGQAAEHNSGASQRIIRLQEMPIDPLQPPKFQHHKLPQGPPSPPAPVMHSPPRKITVQDQQNWKIPPCISNWKNIKGYTIPLDKRLAADGRGLQEVQVSDKIAKLSESLFVAERNARKEIELRNNMMRKMMKKQKEEHEEQLRNRATQARKAAAAKGRLADREADGYEAASKETEEDLQAKQEREELRKDRKRDIKREVRMENMKDSKKLAKGIARDSERDVSEKIALGKAVPVSKDSMFDQRLFNQEDGMAAGFGADDEYSAYDKALFKGANTANYIYRPKANETFDDSDMAKLIEKSTSKFKADKGFAGADASAAATQPRDKPVAFEKDSGSDAFDIHAVVADAREGGRKTLDQIGKRGHMNSAVSKKGDEYSRSSGGDRDIGFEEGSSSKKHKSSRRDDSD